MFDLSSTNNPWGWLVMFVTFLVDNLNESAFVSALRESNHAREYDWQDKNGYKEGFVSHPEWKARYMSDNQCVMISNGWFYAIGKYGYVHVEGRPDLGEISTEDLFGAVMRHAKNKVYVMKMIAALGKGEDSHILADKLLKQVLVDKYGETELVEAYESFNKYFA